MADAVVFIRGLQVEALIGIHEWEQSIKQPLLVDVDMACSVTAAIEKDDIAYAVDYQQVSQCLTEFISGSHYSLVETLAERACRLILDKFPVLSVKISIAKPMAIANASQVGVMFELSRL